MGAPYFYENEKGKQTSSFLLGSAKAKSSQFVLNSTRNSKADTKSKPFNRDIAASFESVAKSKKVDKLDSQEDHSQEAFDQLLEDQRNSACSTANSLPIGPKQVDPPADDLHFTKLEPNTGIQLSKRYTANKDISGYLEGRVLVPISTLYSICLPGESQDGKCTVPIDGDWLIIGAIAQRKKLLSIDGYMLDKNNKRINKDWFKSAYDAYLQRKSGAEPDLNDADNPYNEVYKEVRPSKSQTYTLVDIGQPLANRDTAGDSMLEITVYQADDVQIENGGKRRYTGGSGGAFEMMEKLGAGTVICVLNPMITKGPGMVTKMSNGEPNPSEKRVQDHKQQTSSSDKKMIWLKPRRSENVIAIGVAKNVGQCEAMRKDGLKCNAFIDLRTSMKACVYHCGLSASNARKGRQEFANSTSKMTGLSSNFFRSNRGSAYAFADGMGFSQSRAYVSKGSRAMNAKVVESNYGREAEARRLRHNRVEEEEKIGLRLLDNQKKRTSSKSMSQGQQAYSQQKVDETVNPLGHNHGAKLVKEALQKLQKRSLNLAPTTNQVINTTRNQTDSFKRKRDESIDAHIGGENQTFNNQSFFLKGSMKRNYTPLERTSKLLSRHTASAANLPKPIMRLKQDKGKSSVRTPKGESFYPIDFSDDELDNLVADGMFDKDQQQNGLISGDDDDDFAIVDA